MKRRLRFILATVMCCLLTVNLTARAVFKFSGQTEAVSIQIAKFTLQTKAKFVTDAMVVDSEAEPDEALGEVEFVEENGIYKFPENGTATFTLTATGTAVAGYGIVTIDGAGVYYTDRITGDVSYTFCVTAKEGTTVKIEAAWGAYSDESVANAGVKLIEKNDLTIH